MAYYQIKAGEAECILAGGADSMSTAPHMVFGARYGKKYGNIEMRDSMWDSLTNLGVGPSMGITAENVAEQYGVTREAMDRYALLSQQRAAAAIAEGRFKAEIVPVILPTRKGTQVIDTDEYPRETTFEKLSALKATFQEGGAVTAGNASGMNDAASGVVVMSESKAKEIGCPILCKIVSVAVTGVEPELMGIGPISASQKALAKANLTMKDIDLVEINEAFAAQTLACEKELEIERDKLNVNGGGISLGHPVGATGSRIIITLMNELIRRNKKYGLATLCAGGGMGTAVVIEIMK
jgi:acetyl-CoA C-acetyltransferase